MLLKTTEATITDSLVRPILEYDVEIWLHRIKCDKITETWTQRTEKLETLYLRFIENTAMVRHQATTAVHGSHYRRPLDSRYKIC